MKVMTKEQFCLAFELSKLQVYCGNEESYNDFMQFLQEIGYKWMSGLKPTEKSFLAFWGGCSHYISSTLNRYLGIRASKASIDNKIEKLNWEEIAIVGRKSVSPTTTKVKKEDKQAKIIIMQDGRKTKAKLVINNALICTAETTCSHDDQFNILVGAQIVLHRLINKLGNSKYVLPKDISLKDIEVI